MLSPLPSNGTIINFSNVFNRQGSIGLQIREIRISCGSSHQGRYTVTSYQAASSSALTDSISRGVRLLMIPRVGELTYKGEEGGQRIVLGSEAWKSWGEKRWIP